MESADAASEAEEATAIMTARIYQAVASSAAAHVKAIAPYLVLASPFL